MKLEDIKRSVKHSVLVSLERAIYDACSQIEEEELRVFVGSVLDGVYSDEPAPEAEGFTAQ